jgi:hypothetical protein
MAALHFSGVSRRPAARCHCYFTVQNVMGKQPCPNHHRHVTVHAKPIPHLDMNQARPVPCLQAQVGASLPLVTFATAAASAAEVQAAIDGCGMGGLVSVSSEDSPDQVSGGAPPWLAGPWQGHIACSHVLC